jgi:hypothetical protein
MVAERLVRPQRLKVSVPIRPSVSFPICGFPPTVLKPGNASAVALYSSCSVAVGVPTKMSI